MPANPAKTASLLKCAAWPTPLLRATGADRDSWWLASLGNTLIWARLRIRPAGTAEVLDSDGNTLSYDSEDTARSQLFDAEFVECFDERLCAVELFFTHNREKLRFGGYDSLF